MVALGNFSQILKVPVCEPLTLKNHLGKRGLSRSLLEANRCESVPLQGSKSPKSGKEGFGVKKLPFPSVPEMGALSQNIPIFLVEPCREMGIL